jgi:hypothetical protein
MAKGSLSISAALHAIPIWMAERRFVWTPPSGFSSARAAMVMGKCW